MNNENKLLKIKKHLETVESLNNAITLVDWDMRTNMPSKAVESKSKTLSYLSSESFKKSTDDNIFEIASQLLQDKENLSLIERRMLEEVIREYNETKKIPEDRYISYVTARSNCQVQWEKAKATGNYDEFKPYLKTVVDFSKEFIEYWGYDKNKYNTLLDKYERGLSVEKLDTIFTDLRNGIVEILNNIKATGKTIDTSFLKGNFEIEEQK